jgi:isopentenyl-diphosphate delta-isomerase
MTTSASTVELVVLVDAAGRAIGAMPKSEVHGADTPLHRAFSCYVFDDRGRLLVTRRALDKATFPGLWTNSVCGHPGPEEGDAAAIERRAGDELGLAVRDLALALPDFRYRATFGGVVEHEVCPVHLGRAASDVTPNPAEVADARWLSWAELRAAVAAEPDAWSPWARLQVAELEALPLLQDYATA